MRRHSETLSIVEEKIHDISIESEMKKAYLDYAMSVIIQRALPDVRDGLKPVQRRILYSMYELNLDFKNTTRKSARIVGDVLGKYHPHGDSSVYEAMVRMAQPFSLRYPLIKGQGNFGSIDGDSAAAMRYTEAKMNDITTEMLRDFEKNTVDFKNNFDESEIEPTVLPAHFPNLLVNGCNGIAVGMVSNIPPHNLSDVIDTTIAHLKNSNISLDKMIKIIKGPDFPTGGLIYGDLKTLYKEGRGKFKIKGKAVILPIENKKERYQIQITEIPYQVNKSRLIEKIADEVKSGGINGISDVRDESGKDGILIVIDLKKGTNPQLVLNLLFKKTDLEKSFAGNFLAITTDSKGSQHPSVLNLAEILEYYERHQLEIIKRRTEFDLERAERKLEITEGLIIALDAIDRVIEIIRSSRDVKTAKRTLMVAFPLNDVQTQAVLDMRLQRLTSLESDKLRIEAKVLFQQIENYKNILASDENMKKVIIKELREIKKKYSDVRLTEIVKEDEIIEIETMSLIEKKNVSIEFTNKGYIFKKTIESKKEPEIRDGDFIEKQYNLTTHDTLLIFTDQGMMYQLIINDLPDNENRAIVNLLDFNENETIKDIIPISTFHDHQYISIITKNGMFKKTLLKAYETNRKNGIVAISLSENDLVVNAFLSVENTKIGILTENGNLLLFETSLIRPISRGSKGVHAITLGTNDSVVGSAVYFTKGVCTVITENGLARYSNVSKLTIQKHGGKGVNYIKTTVKSGKCIGIFIANQKETMAMINIFDGTLFTASFAKKHSQKAQGFYLFEGKKFVSAVLVKINIVIEEPKKLDLKEVENKSKDDLIQTSFFDL